MVFLCVFRIYGRTVTRSTEVGEQFLRTRIYILHVKLLVDLQWTLRASVLGYSVHSLFRSVEQPLIEQVSS